MSELAEIYRIYFDDVYRYLLALSHDAQLAEELTSETFCRAMRALPGFRGACDIRVWLCQIAKNCFYTEQKRMGRIELLDDGKMEALPASAPSLEEQLTDRDDAARIRAALHSAPEPYKEVFLWRALGGLQDHWVAFRQIGKLGVRDLSSRQNHHPKKHGGINMNQECSIVRDLLPLYAERLTSPETASFVEKHLRTCADCRAALQETQAPPALQPAPGAAPLQHLQKRLARKRLQIIVMTALFVLTAVISAAGILNAPIYFPYTDDLVQVTEDAGALELTFRADVANVSTERFVDPDDPLREICLVEAWSTLWERWFSGPHTQAARLEAEGGKPLTVLYSENDGTEAVYLAGKPMASGGMIALPSLTLNYYAFVALIVLAAAVLVRIFVRKKPRACVWTERVILLPVAYLLAHVTLLGLTATTYSLPHDFVFVFCAALLLYCALLLLHGLLLRLRSKQEY